MLALPALPVLWVLRALPVRQAVTAKWGPQVPPAHRVATGKWGPPVQQVQPELLVLQAQQDLPVPRVLPAPQVLQVLPVQ